MPPEARTALGSPFLLSPGPRATPSPPRPLWDLISQDPRVPSCSDFLVLLSLLPDQLASRWVALSPGNPAQNLLFFLSFFLLSFVSLEPHPWHMEVPRLGLELEL